MEYSSKKKTNYIFTFGNIGVGKSTLMTALSKVFFTKTVLHINPTNPDGTRVLVTEWLENLNKSEFPPKTRLGEIIQIDIGAEFTRGEGETIKLTFLEMSGEDLVKVDMREKEEKGVLGDQFVAFIKVAKVFLVVTDYNRAQEDDMLIWQFFNTLTAYGADISKVGLIISKWDLNRKSYGLEEFVSKKMPQTLTWLHSEEMEQSRVFSFTIGETEEDRILQLSLKDSEEIIRWLHECLTD